MDNPTAPTVLPQARILVVDDHLGTATTLARVISQLGPKIEVVSATSGKMALDQVRESAVDLLITDMMMPDMNGLELIEKLQSHPAGRPAYTILITAYDVPGLKESARRLKVDETIIKPLRPERIRQIVSKALEDLGPSKLPGQMKETRQSYKILIVDDVNDNLTLLSRYLVNEGYSVITANNGAVALEKTRAEMPDLILLDVNMPEKDGFEVLKEIRLDPAVEHIPVIILTAARPDPVHVRAGLNLGADDYVTKPFDRRELLARIHTKLRAKEAEASIRRRYKELSVLPEIGKDLSARLDMDEITGIVLRRSVETLGAIVGHAIILNSGKPIYKEYHLSTSAPDFEAQLPPVDALLALVKETYQGMIVDDIYADPRWPSTSDAPAGSAIIVPMFGRLDVIGLLVLIHEQAGYFKSDHLLLLQAIASQAAIAVENARLYASATWEQQRSAAILQSTTDAILMFDAEGRLSLLNPAGKKLFTDYHANLGEPLALGKGYDALIALLTEALVSKEQKAGEITWPDHRAFSMQLTPLERDGCVVVLHDITHFKNLERSKNEFIYATLHDLKNPLGIITGFSELISRVGPLNEKQSEFMRHICSASGNMNELVHNLLELPKMDIGPIAKQETVDMNDLAAEVKDEFQPKAEAKGQVLQLRKAGDQAKVQGYPLQLQQAIRNLVDNAIKYTPEGGLITLSLEARNHQVSIKVQDSGPGIPPEDLPFIFDRFYRVDNADTKNIEGNGLGLAIAKSIIEQHGGEVSILSEPGKGSSFTCTIPLARVTEHPNADTNLSIQSNSDLP